MPTYEYECPCCSSRFELRRSFNDDTPASCPDCGSVAQQIYSPVPIIFKGSGFYVTDSRGNHSHSLPASSADKDKAGSTDQDKAGSADKDKAGSAEKSS